LWRLLQRRSYGAREVSVLVASAFFSAIFGVIFVILIVIIIIIIIIIAFALSAVTAIVHSKFQIITCSTTSPAQITEGPSATNLCRDQPDFGRAPAGVCPKRC
jgi:hypothetical protein